MSAITFPQTQTDNTAMKNITRPIPNLITCMNLICGGISTVLSFSGEFMAAAVLVFAAAVFDFMDGLAARLLKAYSDTGKELDSLADTVSFGLAPAMMMHNVLAGPHGSTSIIALSPLILAAASAYRLARFNVDSRQETMFIGMPTPACAILVVSGISYAYENGRLLESLGNSMVAVPLAAVVLSYLLNAEIPMISMKFKTLSFNSNIIRYLFLFTAAVTATVTAFVSRSFSAVAFMTILSYIGFNIIIFAIKLFMSSGNKANDNAGTEEKKTESMSGQENSQA